MWMTVTTYNCGTEFLSPAQYACAVLNLMLKRSKTLLLNVQEENGGIAQSVERSLCKREVQRSKLCASKKKNFFIDSTRT